MDVRAVNGGGRRSEPPWTGTGLSDEVVGWRSPGGWGACTADQKKKPRVQSQAREQTKAPRGEKGKSCQRGKGSNIRTPKKRLGGAPSGSDAVVTVTTSGFLLFFFFALNYVGRGFGLEIEEANCMELGIRQLPRTEMGHDGCGDINRDSSPRRLVLANPAMSSS